MFGVGCESPEPGFDPGPPEREIVHPVESALLSSDPGAPVVDVRLEGGEGAERPDGLGLNAFDENRAVGIPDGPDAETLGSIRDAAVLRDGRVVLVDGDYGLVRVHTAEGEPLELVGAFGDGPGEFVDPVAVIALESGGFEVVSRVSGHGRLERFEPAGESFEFRGRQLLPTMGEDGSRICRLGARTYVTGLLTREITTDEGRTLGALDASGWIHELDGQGEVMRSFGTPYPRLFEETAEVAEAEDTNRARSVMGATLEVAFTLGATRLACSEGIDGGRIWAAYTGLGEVHAYTPKGELVWIAGLGDLSTPRILQRDFAFGSSVGRDPSGPMVVQQLTHVALLSPNVLAVQVRTLGDPTDARTYLLDPVSGELKGGFEAGHHVIGGGDGRAILYREAPHPQVSIAQVHAGNGGG